MVFRTSFVSSRPVEQARRSAVWQSVVAVVVDIAYMMSAAPQDPMDLDDDVLSVVALKIDTSTKKRKLEEDSSRSDEAPNKRHLRQSFPHRPKPVRVIKKLVAFGVLAVQTKKRWRH